MREIKPRRRTFRGEWEGIDLLEQRDIDRSLNRLENFFPKRVVSVLQEFAELSVFDVKVKKVVTYTIEPLGPYERMESGDCSSWSRVVPNEELEFTRKMLKTYIEKGKVEKALKVHEIIKKKWPEVG